MPAPTTQNNHVTKTQIAWAPMDATGCLDQLGCIKSSVYAPPVSDVQEEAKLKTIFQEWLKRDSERGALTEVVGFPSGIIRSGSCG